MAWKAFPVGWHRSESAIAEALLEYLELRRYFGLQAARAAGMDAIRLL